MIRFENVTKVYSTYGRRRTILDRVNFTLKPGISYGATDEFGYNAVEKPVHINDFHATLLRLLGIDHARLTYRFQGRDFRLTDIHGEVVKQLLA